MITYLHSVVCLTVVGALVLPTLSRTPKSVERMQVEVDEEKQYRANRLLYGTEDVSDDQLWGALCGLRGAWSMVQQARLMNGIVAEKRKLGQVAEKDAAELQDILRRMGVDFRLTIGEMLTVKAGEPRRHFRALVVSYALIGNIFDGIVSESYGQTEALLL